MNSKAPDVDTYLEQLPDERREPLNRLRLLCRKTLKGYEEGMQYGMPAYLKAGVMEVAFASQKQYISLYILKDSVLREHQALSQGLSVGKGCVRFRNIAAMDFALIRKLLQSAVASPAEPC